MQKPFAESCDENGQVILEVITPRLPGQGTLLEIGSGTGQHAVKFAAALPGITWQTSDRATMHPGITMWLEEAGLPNTRPPIALDVINDPWPGEKFDAAFSANTAHIMPPEAVAAMFAGLSRVLVTGAPFLLYGPFMYHGEQTSESNRRFDEWLHLRAPHQGIRDVDWLLELAEPLGFTLQEDIEMPVNNRTLLWKFR